MADDAPIIMVLFFEPGRCERLARVREDVEDFHRLLGSTTLDATFLQVRDRLYAIWCDDDAYAKSLPDNRRLIGHQAFAGHMMKGAFFISRVRGDRDTSVTLADLPYIAEFVEFQAKGVTQ